MRRDAKESRIVMRVYDIIERKRDGVELGRDEIRALVEGFTSGRVADYEMAAWLMAACIRGLTRGETVALTDAMRASGGYVDLSGLPRPIVDKHSTGGVGDNTTLVVAPVVAATGLPVAKMSGRALGHTGGTLDKLEAIPGLRTDLTKEELQRQVQAIGLAITGQTADLAPADRAIYALRDATATVHSIGLIASSIMSKKLAVDADAIVLDVKVGRGAFMQRLADARDLAETMVAIGRAAGRRVGAVLSSMDQPLGRAVGNACEVAEALQVLEGEGPNDLRELCLELAARMVLLADGAADVESGKELAAQAIESGAARDKLLQMVEAQGGDVGALVDVARLPRSRFEVTLRAPRDGIVQRVDALVTGRAAVAAGAGRSGKDGMIDHGAGIALCRKVGEAVAAGEPLAVIRASDEKRARAAHELLASAYCIGPEAASPRPLVVEAFDT